MMNATEFCNYFEFSIYKPSEDVKKRYATEDGVIANFVMIDDQGVFHDRVCEKIEEIVDCFDSMLMDYVESTLEDFGFEYDQKSDLTYYEQAHQWLNSDAGKELQGTDTYKVVEALTDPSKIIDDVTEVF